jgi:hypothetical protein
MTEPISESSDGRRVAWWQKVRQCSHCGLTVHVVGGADTKAPLVAATAKPLQTGSKIVSEGSHHVRTARCRNPPRAHVREP